MSEGRYQISRKQREFLGLLTDPSISELLCGGAAGGAKTMCMCLGIVELSKLYPGVRIFVGRKTLKSLKQSTIATLLNKVHPMLGVTRNDFAIHFSDMTLDYQNGSKIIFGELESIPSDEDFARIGSLEIDVAFVDEAGEITLKAKNAIKSRVGRGVMSSEYGIPGKVILSCNPSMNFLRQEYYEPFTQLGGGGFQKWKIGSTTVNGEEIETYRAFLKMDAYDNPFLPQSYIDNLKTLPDRERKRLLEGDWNYADDEGSLFRAGLLDKAITYDLPPMSEKFDKWIGCFDESTEILTENGFKKFKDLQGEKVLARKSSGSSEYINYDSYIEYEYEGDMYSLENQGASVFVTPNHRMLYASPKGETKLEEIQNISLGEWKIIRKHEYRYGLYQNEFPFHLGYNKKDFFSFLGWFISEGCVIGDKVVEISQKNEEKKAIIAELLVKMGVRFSIHGNNFNISNKELAQWLLDNVKKYAHNKEIPRFVTFCNNWGYVEAFLDAYCDGDGMRRNGDRLCYVSSSKKIIDSLQIILAHFNKQGRISLHNRAGTEFEIEGRKVKRRFDTYILYERKTDSDAWVKKKQIKKVPFRGKVYCVSNKYHTIYVRRNGICYWIGNCDVAGQGGDRSVYTLFDNGVVVNQKVSAVQTNWEKTDQRPLFRLMADELVEFAQRNGFTQVTASHIVVEGNGIGQALITCLKERGWYLTEYTATHKSRSEGYYNLMLAMDSGELKILNTLNGLDDLRRELSAHSYEFVNQEPSVVKKEKIKMVLGRSPDLADSLMIAYWGKWYSENTMLNPRINRNRIVF